MEISEGLASEQGCEWYSFCSLWNHQYAYMQWISRHIFQELKARHSRSALQHFTRFVAIIFSAVPVMHLSTQCRCSIFWTSIGTLVLWEAHFSPGFTATSIITLWSFFPAVSFKNKVYKSLHISIQNDDIDPTNTTGYCSHTVLELGSENSNGVQVCMNPQWKMGMWWGISSSLKSKCNAEITLQCPDTASFNSSLRRVQCNTSISTLYHFDIWMILTN